MVTAITLLIVGCAGVDPTQLQEASSLQTIEIRSLVKYDDYYRISGNTFTYKLKAGKYVARYMNSNGTYFEGEGKCLEVSVHSPSAVEKGLQLETELLRCGVYISKSSSEQPKIYLYRSPEKTLAVGLPQDVSVLAAPSTAAAGAAGGIAMGLLTAIDSAEAKNLHFARGQPPDDRLKREIVQ
jgi:hypothetical protein